MAIDGSNIQQFVAPAVEPSGNSLVGLLYGLAQEAGSAAIQKKFTEQHAPASQSTPTVDTAKTEKNSTLPSFLSDRNTVLLSVAALLAVGLIGYRLIK